MTYICSVNKTKTLHEMKNLTLGEKLLRIRNSRENAIEEIEFWNDHIKLEKMVAETIFMSKKERETKILECAKRIANLVEVIKELDELKKAMED